jgi:hypothetical protein
MIQNISNFIKKGNIEKSKKTTKISQPYPLPPPLIFFSRRPCSFLSCARLLQSRGLLPLLAAATELPCFPACAAQPLPPLLLWSLPLPRSVSTTPCPSPSTVISPSISPAHALVLAPRSFLPCCAPCSYCSLHAAAHCSSQPWSSPAGAPPVAQPSRSFSHGRNALAPALLVARAWALPQVAVCPPVSHLALAQSLLDAQRCALCSLHAVVA